MPGRLREDAGGRPVRVTRLPFCSALLVLATSLFPACGSEPDAPLTPAPEARSSGLRALVTSSGGLRIVLRAGVEEAMGHGPITLLSEEAPLVVRRSAHLEGLTADEVRWSGQQVSLHNEHGVVCQGIVDQVEVVGRFHTNEGITADWYDEQGALKLGPEELSRRAWELAPELGSLDLTGRIRVLSGDCEGAIWAQASEEQSAPVVAAEPAPRELERLALEAERGTQAYREAQEQYEEFRREAPEGSNAGGFPERWEDYNASVHVTLIAHPGGETLLATAIQAGEGCGDFLGSTLHLWRVEGERLEEVPAEGLDVETTISGAADVDGDGRLDLLIPSGYVRQEQGGFVERRSTEIPANLGCNC